MMIRGFVAIGLMAAAAAAAMGAAPASAQGRGTVFLSLMGEPFVTPVGQAPMAKWLALADADRNGMISLAELTGDADRFFKSLDVDRDGRIGGYELTRYEEEIAPAHLRAAAGMRPVGSDKEERTEIQSRGITDPQGQQRRGRRMLPGGMTGPSLSMSELGIDPSTGANAIPQPVAMADTDMSGSITPDEFTRAAERRFDTADTNRNGLLDANELSGRKR